MTQQRQERMGFAERTFGALRERPYALLLGGNFLSTCGTWLHSVAVGYVVADRTKSSFLVGLVAFCNFVPALVLGLFGGVLADRFDRRRLLIISQWGELIVTGLLAVLFAVGAGSLAAIYAVTLALGVSAALAGPAWFAFYPTIVDPAHLPSAVSLNGAQYNVARAVGPSIGGFVLGAFGPAAAFGLNSLSFLAFIVPLTYVRFRTYVPHRRPGAAPADLAESGDLGAGGTLEGTPDEADPAGPEDGGIRAVTPDAAAPDAVAPDAVASDAVASDAVASDAVAPDAVAPDAVAPDAAAPWWREGFDRIGEAFAYVRATRWLATLLLSMVVQALFAAQLITLLADFGRNDFGLDATGVGWLFALLGLGGIIGSGAAANLVGHVPRHRLVPALTAAMGAGVVVMGLVPSATWAYIAIFFAGIAYIGTLSSLNALVQLDVDNDMRGRVSAMWFTIFVGLFPIAALGWGAVGAFVSTQTTYVLGGCVVVAWALLLAARPHWLTDGDTRHADGLLSTAAHAGAADDSDDSDDSDVSSR